ncbi:hypothetical protein [Hydrocarboniclastica marina]|uniref:Uncharacterized protein n=1 Tax=Hydrocarboniclastica marina TaxID=2259620 RepID=A0A4P7XJV3_9ALTE|nr:hypothetical protein [Hydrocarboniclastica marina]QCF26157.1 hypothetical protein soil367_09555 [Hydrocarboniclastica marina]
MLSMNIDLFSRELALGAPITQRWLSLAKAIVFGLVFASCLTLIITPCALMVPARILERMQRKPSNNGYERFA